MKFKITQTIGNPLWDLYYLDETYPSRWVYINSYMFKITAKMMARKYKKRNMKERTKYFTV